MPHNSFSQSPRYCNCLSARAVGSVLELVNWKTVESRHRSARAIYAQHSPSRDRHALVRFRSCSEPS
ncbi:hypothetical protein CALCODRAFT_497547, partial [Calocera cornea HHB12733]